MILRNRTIPGKIKRTPSMKVAVYKKMQGFFLIRPQDWKFRGGHRRTPTTNFC